MDVDSMEGIVYLTKKGLPVYGSIVPNAGMSAPFSLAGTLALGNAEFLALGVLQQMIRPGSQLIYSVLSTVGDMRTAGYAPGGIETAILQMAHSQMARYYRVPSGGYIGVTNAHANDAQSGYETGMGTTAALLAGTDVFNTGGLLSSLMAFDYAKAVIDSEIALMLKRIRRGVEVSAENLCLDVVAEVGPGGTFLDHADTTKRVRRTALYPRVATRETRVSWEQHGRPDAYGRALKEAERILSRHKPAAFSQETERKIRARFAGLVAGNVVWQK
jgi:trimethylamine--corrinoid protein Co-methyltransferase